MDKSEKRFERDIESFLISPKGGYTQFCGQDADGNWVHTRQHDIAKCIYMDVLCEFIAKTQPKDWAKYTKYYGASAPDKLYHRLETTISNQGLLYVLRNGIEDMGCKLKVCLRWAKLFPFLDVRVWIQPSTNRSTKIIQKFLVDFILIFEYTIDGRNGSSAVAHIKRKMLIDLRQQREKLEFIGAFFR